MHFVLLHMNLNFVPLVLTCGLVFSFLAKRDAKCLFLKNVPFSATKEDILKMFRKAVDVRFPGGTEGPTKGWDFLWCQICKTYIIELYLKHILYNRYVFSTELNFLIFQQDCFC